MLIAFVHSGKAFLPGIEAYRKFFSLRGIESTVVVHGDPLPELVDIEWHFMGTHTKQLFKNSIIIHEYASASISPFGHIKDRIKRFVNIKPDLRLFLNDYVRRRLNFQDDIPFGYRDIGIDQSLLEQPPISTDKEYDFIFTGSITKDMKMEALIDRFVNGPLRNKTLLIVSKNHEQLSTELRNCKNIFFAGPVKQSEVWKYNSKARFGVNYKPALEPYAYQTSTKLLEYAACRIPIITSDLPWIRNFQKQYGGNYFYLNEDMSNFTWENISNFNYAFPSLESWTWEKQITRSGVLEFLLERFNGRGSMTESLRKEI